MFPKRTLSGLLHPVECSFGLSNPLGASNDKVLTKFLLKVFQRVAQEDICPGREESLNLRIAFGDELDDQGLAQVGEAAGDLRKGTLLEIARWWISASAKTTSAGPRRSSDIRSRFSQPDPG